MKDKIKDILGLGDPIMKYQDLDTEYRGHFVKEFALSVVGVIIGVIFSALFKKLSYSLIFVGAGCLYWLFLLYQIRQSICGAIIYIDATVIDLNRKEHRLLSGLTDRMGGDVKTLTTTNDLTLILEDENHTKYKQKVSDSSDYKVGDVLRFYTHPHGINQIDRNTYCITTPVFVSRIS